MVRERAVSKIMSGSWLVDLVVSFLATGVTGIRLNLGQCIMSLVLERLDSYNIMKTEILSV